MSKTKKYLKGIWAGIVSAFAISFIFTVYAPLELFIPGQNEFWFSLSDIIYPILILFFAVFLAVLILLAILKLFGDITYHVGLLVLFAASVILYLHGNFLVSNLPPLDGTSVEWNANMAERLKSYGVIAAVIIILVVVFIKFKKSIFNKTVLYGSLALIFMLVFTLSTLLMNTPIVNKSEDLTVTGYNTFEYSSDTNLIVLCIDALDSQHFLSVLKNDPDFADVFDDFTYYDDALAGYTFTRNSLPFMYSGVWYENEFSFKEYCNTAMKQAPITKKLLEDNYKAGLYDRENIVLNSKEYDGVFENLFNSTPEFSSLSDSVKLVAKMSTVKYAPWDLKKYGYDIAEYAQSIKNTPNSNDTAVYYENSYFYSMLSAENPITVTEDKCARFLHIEGSHVPFIYDKEVNIIENGDYRQNIAASITICNKFLQRLKESGVYDNSAIVILGDHGFQTENIEDNDLTIRMNPALMIKGIGDKGDEIKFNSTPVSYKDLSETFVDLLEKKPTNELFTQFDYKDGRRFFEYHYLSEDHLEEYVAYGKAYEIDKCEPTGKTYDLDE